MRMIPEGFGPYEGMDYCLDTVRSRGGEEEMNSQDLGELKRHDHASKTKHDLDQMSNHVLDHEKNLGLGNMKAHGLESEGDDVLDSMRG